MHEMRYVRCTSAKNRVARMRKVSPVTLHACSCNESCHTYVCNALLLLITTES